MNHKYLGFIRSWRLSNLKDTRRLRNWGLFMRTSDMLHQNEKVFLKSETRTNDHTTTTTIFPRILLKKKCVLWSNEGWNWVIYEDTSLNLHQEKPTSEYAFSQKSIKSVLWCIFTSGSEWLHQNEELKMDPNFWQDTHNYHISNFCKKMLSCGLTSNGYIFEVYKRTLR